MSDFSVDEVETLLCVAREASGWGGESVERRLTALTDQLGRLVPFFSLTMLVVGPDGPRLLLNRNAAQTDLAAYAERYMPLDPMFLSGSFGTSRIVTMSDVVGPHARGRDAMTGEFLPRRGLRHVLAASPRLPDGSLLALGIHREEAAPDFCAKERRVLQLLSADLARAAHATVIQERVGRLARTPASPDATEGAVVFDARGDVVHADEVGSALLRLLEEAAPIDLLARSAPRAPLAIDQLVDDVRRVAGGADGAALEASLRLAAGGRLRVRLDRLPGEPHVVGRLLLERPAPPSRLEAFAGRHGITDREREVAALAIEGLGNRGIAYKLGISEPTVATHLTKVYRKAGVSNRTELARAVHGR